MPGWHQATQKYAANEELQVLGIVQEQHPNRAALFMQWKEMDWPLFSDPFNELGISAVPITLFIDEAGIIRHKNPKRKALAAFLSLDSSPKDNETAAQVLPLKRIPHSIPELEHILEASPNNAAAHFALGVAYRQRYDSDTPEANDFRQAVSHWRRALALNPDQYIWRRRIQQYGPRLDKPYSFYDWVAQARSEIIARGEVPTPLKVEPSGAEFAKPLSKRSRKNSRKALPSPPTHPDPEGLLTRDEQKLVTTTIVGVPATHPKQSARRFHLTLRPTPGTSWTNDAGPLSLHLEPNSKALIQDLSLPTPPNTETSSEERTLEFEIHPQGKENLPSSLSISLFYYVCTENDHTCRFLRQDLILDLPHR